MRKQLCTRFVKELIRKLIWKD